jgi:hypothetical protein
MNLAKRVAGLLPRKSLAVGDAAYLVQDRQGGMWDDAVALLIETITTAELLTETPARPVDTLRTTVAMLDLLAWMDRIAPATVDLGDSEAVNNVDIPGKLPKIGACKLAVEAAWEIERKKKRLATARETMEQLQEWADQGGKPDVLLRSERGSRAVVWQTTKGREKEYDLEACGKALEAWKKSRA